MKTRAAASGGSEAPVLVTGGAGFIGSHSVELLLRRGCPVRVLDNLSHGRLDNLPRHAQLEFVEGDIRDRDLVRTAMQGVQRVLHLAAQVSVDRSLQDPGDSASINLGGFLNVLEACRQIRVSRLVYASSAAVYGLTTESPVTEQTPLQPVSPYGLEKRVNEDYANLYHRLYRTATLGLRYFNVYGERQDEASPYSGVLARFVANLRSGQPLTVHGDGEQSRDFIHVDDVAQANVRALFGPAVGVLNIGSGRAVSLNQVIRVLAELHDRAPQIQHETYRLGDIRHSCADNTQMQQLLGEFDFVPIESGLQRLLGMSNGSG